MYSRVGLCMAMYNGVGLCMAIYNCVGLCIAIYSCVGLCIAMYSGACPTVLTRSIMCLHTYVARTTVVTGTDIWSS